VCCAAAQYVATQCPRHALRCNRLQHGATGCNRWRPAQRRRGSPRRYPPWDRPRARSRVPTCDGPSASAEWRVSSCTRQSTRARWRRVRCQRRNRLGGKAARGRQPAQAWMGWGGTGWDGTGRDGMERDGTGWDGTGRDGGGARRRVVEAHILERLQVLLRVHNQHVRRRHRRRTAIAPHQKPPTRAVIRARRAPVRPSAGSKPTNKQTNPKRNGRKAKRRRRQSFPTKGYGTIRVATQSALLARASFPAGCVRTDPATLEYSAKGGRAGGRARAL
jgi:hypothetical protein